MNKAAEKSAAIKENDLPGHKPEKETPLEELDVSEILEKNIETPEEIVLEYEPNLFGEEGFERDVEDYLNIGKEFLKILEEERAAEQARANKEEDLIGSKDAEKLLKPKYEFRDYYDSKQSLSDSLALRMGVSQKKLDELKSIAEMKDSKNVFTTTFDSGIANASAAITGGLDVLLGKPLQALGWENNPISTVNDYYQKRSDKKYTEMMNEVEKTGYGKPMEYAAKLGSGLVSSVPNVLVAYMSGGSSAIAQGGAITNVLKNPAFWYSFETSLYPEYERALMNGATENEATLVAPIASLFDAGIEVGGGIEKLPKIMQNGGMRNKILKNWVKVAVEEGNESVLQDMTSGLTQKVLFDHRKDWVSFDKNNDAVLNVPKSFENWMASAAAGGVLSAPLTIKSALSKNTVTNIYKYWYSNHKEDFGENIPDTFAEYEQMMYNKGKSKELNEIKEKIIVIEKTPCILTQKKISNYMLENGKKHSQEFFNVGYKKEDALLLKYDIAKQYDIKKAFGFGTGYKEQNITFSIFMDLGITKKKRFRTVWQIDKPGDIPRIISCHAED